MNAYPLSTSLNCLNPQVARTAASLGAKATKVAIKYAPVDGTVKDLVSGGADIIVNLAEADPDASVSGRGASK